MWTLLLKLTVLTVLLYGLYHWTFRGHTFFRFNRFYLLGGILLAGVLPFIPIYYHTDTIHAVAWSEGTFHIGNVVSFEMKIHESIDFKRIMGFVYLSGVIVLLVLRSWSVFRLLKDIGRGTKTTVAGFTLVESPSVQSSFSFFRYMVLPQGMDKTARKVILTHEQTHIRQRHYIDLFLGEAFCIIQWFNPFAWLYKRDMIENHEFLADKSACSAAGIDIYKDTLTRYWLYGTMKSLVNPFACSTRLMRLSMLKKPSSVNIQKCWAVGLVPLLLVYAWIFSIPVARAEIMGEQQITMVGMITDEVGRKVVAASLIVPQKAWGTISDMDGNYQLSVGSKDTVYISMSGYEKQEICVADYTVKDAEIVIDVQLQPLK